MKRIGFAIAFLVLFILHQDFWLWNDASIVFGLPVGMTYHVLYCVAAVVFFAALVKWAWPFEADAEEQA